MTAAPSRYAATPAAPRLTARSASRVCSDAASSSAYTATVSTPRSPALRAIRTAISPRLAISRLLGIRRASPSYVPDGGLPRGQRSAAGASWRPGRRRAAAGGAAPSGGGFIFRPYVALGKFLSPPRRPAERHGDPASGPGPPLGITRIRRPPPPGEAAAMKLLA